MKFFFLIQGLFILSSSNCISQRNDTIKIEVINCQSSIVYFFDGDSVIIKDEFFQPQIFSGVKTGSTDYKRFSAIARLMFETKGDEVLDIPCIQDGFAFKIYISFNSQHKKIFVGNYYDKRADSLIKIFDKYINRENPILKYNAFRYPDNAETINEMIVEQNACDMVISEEMKKHLLHRFCEY